MTLLPYFLVGVAFGALIVQAEVVSWFRIQEMFRFHAFHMYGIMGAAVATGALSLAIIRRLGLRDSHGEPLHLPQRRLADARRYAAGGTIFGLGWALTGACPGPLVALIGAGAPVMIIALVSALAGTWTYGRFRRYLPH